MKMYGNTLKLSTSFHPQTDGQTERVHRTIEQVLHCLLKGKPSNWVHVLSHAEMYYNN